MFRIREIGWFLPAHFSLIPLFCAVRDIEATVGPSPQGRKSDFPGMFMTEKRSGINASKNGIRDILCCLILFLTLKLRLYLS
jgi:hypothetical protein